MEDKCLTIKNEVIEAPNLCYAENIEGRFFTSPKQMVENHYDQYPIKYVKDLEGYVSDKTEGSTQDIGTTLPEIEHFIAVTEHSESEIINKFSDVNNINGTSSVFSSNEDVASSCSSQNKKVFEKAVHPFSCDTCGKNYTSKRYLTFHKRYHLGERPFSCDHCGKNFTCQTLLTIHQKIHSGERSFSCDICGKNYAYKQRLTIHKRIHTGERPFSCDICGKNFISKHCLTTHKRIHTGERPFSCDICGKNFISKHCLTTHKRIHTGLRPYVCDICDKKFTQNSNLREHKKIHTGVRIFNCDICGKNFTLKTNLNRHIIAHRGVRIFNCDICGKNFTLKANLNRHIIAHRGLRPYVCDICGKKFTQDPHLRNHKKLHTDPDFTAEGYYCRECDKRFRSKNNFEQHKREAQLNGCKNRKSVRKTHRNEDNNETGDIHTKFEGYLPENITPKHELYFSDFTDNNIIKDECLTIKNEVIESPDICNLEHIQEKFITSPNQMIGNRDENIKKYIQLLEGYMSGESQGSAQEIETALREIDNFIEMVESSKSDIKN